MITRPANPEGSFVTPSFEHARVADAMRAGVITCPPNASLATVARMMAANHVHAVVVTDLDPEGEDERPWGLVTDMDIARMAGARFDDAEASGSAHGEVVTIGPDEPLQRAAETMTERDVSHLVVVDATHDRPLGVVSTLDLAGILAWGRG